MARMVKIFRNPQDIVISEMMIASGTTMERIGDVEGAQGVGYYSLVGTPFICPIIDLLVPFEKDFLVPTSPLEIMKKEETRN